MLISATFFSISSRALFRNELFFLLNPSSKKAFFCVGRLNLGASSFFFPGMFFCYTKNLSSLGKSFDGRCRIRKHAFEEMLV